MIAGKEKAIFSTHTRPTYVRNVDCWAYGLDLTAISPWNSGGGFGIRGGTLISPRHIIFAAHWADIFSVDETLEFVTQDNDVITRTISARSLYPTYATLSYPDIGVALLDEDVPSSITFVKVLPDDWEDYFPVPAVPPGYSIFESYDVLRMLRIPLLITDQEEKALVLNTTTFGDRYLYPAPPAEPQATIYWEAPGDDARLLYYEAIVGGDSSSPVCMIINDELVLLATVGASSSGSSCTHFKDGINTLMTDLGGDYQLTEIDLSGFQKV